MERGDGVETKAIKTSYSSTAGTAYITFENVKVPVENTLGPVNGGVFVILSNFNHERWVMVTATVRAQRNIVEECLKWVPAFPPQFPLTLTFDRWVNQRKAFGKPLSSQAVIRSKLADMIARVESQQAWLENITYQMNNMVRPPLPNCDALPADALLTVVLQGASQFTRGSNRSAEDDRDTRRAGHSPRRRANIRWPWYHQDWYGPYD